MVLMCKCCVSGPNAGPKVTFWGHGTHAERTLAKEARNRTPGAMLALAARGAPRGLWGSDGLGGAAPMVSRALATV